MKLAALALALLCLTVGCTTTDSTPPPRSQRADVGAPMARGVATDPDYGYKPEKPIKVGGAFDGGPLRERLFLGSLRGPAGEAVRFERRGSCCAFETPNGMMGRGLLDQYAVWIGDSAQPVTLYVNMYDFEAPKAPVGFTPAGG